MRKTLYTLITFIMCVSAFFCGSGFTTENKEEREKDGISLPILMYHAVVPDKYAADAYTVKIKDFVSDLDYIRNNGYTTVLPRDIISYVKSGTPLPEKPVLISFDDGFRGVMTLALPELEKRGQCAAVAVVGKFLRGEDEQTSLYAYLSKAECKEIHGGGHIEIISHSYDLHKLKPRKGVKRLWGESDEAYAEFLKNDTEKLHGELNGTGIFPTSYAYPFGAFDKKSDEVLRGMGYSLTLGCREKTNVITRDENCLFGLGRYNRHGTKKDLLEKILG